MRRWAAAGVVGLVVASLLGLAVGQDEVSATLEQPLQLAACSGLKFFDTTTLECRDCPAGQFPTADQLACVTCDVTANSFYNFVTGVSLRQTWIEALSQSSTSCACRAPPANATTVLALAQSNGQTVQRCVVCPAGTTANSVQQCVPTDGTSLPLTPDQMLQLAMSSLNVGGFSTATTASIPVPAGNSGGTTRLTVQRSQPLADILGPASYNCMMGGGADDASCNAVANLCAVQLYDANSAACRLYEALVRRFTGSTTGGTTDNPWQPNTGGMPWLFYQGSNYRDDPNLDLQVQFSGGSLADGEVSVLTFVLSAYLLNGTWLGFSSWTSEMQLCGAPKLDGARWNRVGWAYNNHCWIKLESLLSEVAPSFVGGGGTVVFEPFLQTGPNTMYPIPVVVRNRPLTAAQQQIGDTGAVRRFFFVDRQLGYSSQARALQAVQYPTDMRLEIMLRKDPRGQIHVPQLTVNYLGWQTTTTSNLELDPSDSNEWVQTAFSVAYVNEPDLVDDFWYAWQVILIVFEVVLAFPAMMLAVFRYMRKKRDQADLDFLMYAGVCILDYGSYALAMVLLVVTLYYLILYKLQEEVYYMMLADDQIYNFKVTVILAIVGQTVGIIYCIYSQIRTDVFFVDWEKPRKVLSKEGTKEEDSPISAWRMLMVANEWNELQTVRVTYPAFTLLMMVMILEGANVIFSGNVTPDASDFRSWWGTTWSIILRMGVEAFFFLVLFLGQYLYKKLLYYPYVSNPVTQFIDLMFLANISTVVFDDSHSGYYIHGRNMAQHSDATLRDLNQELLKEEDGLTAQRGLVTASSNPKLADNQMFLLYVTDSIRKTYDARMLQLVQQASNDARNRKGSIKSFFHGTGRQKESVLSAQQEIGLLFKQMVEDVERNQATQVVDPTYLQMVTQLPPDNSINAPAMVHDYFQSFTTTMFLGCEARLYVYEALFFCAVDMELRNVCLTALLTFLMSRALAYVRQAFGEDNLSEKTLVDRHFLI